MKVLFDKCARCLAEDFCTPLGTAKKPYCFACRAELFFDGVLLAPHKMKLPPWQREYVRRLLGTVDQDGVRQYRDTYVEVPKKNAKSFLGGGLSLYFLFYDSEYPKVYGAAASKGQAGLVFESAVKLLRTSVLNDKAKILPSTKRVNTRDGKGYYQVLSADGDLQDGIEPSLFICDEFHRWRYEKSKTLYEIGTKGQITVESPLCFKITTSGDEHESPMCWAEHEYAGQVLGGDIEASQYLPVIYSADIDRHKADTDYWKTKEARVAANPSHEDNGGFLKDSAIVLELNKAIETPSKRSAYLRYHLNLWPEGDSKFTPMEAWRACGSGTKPLIGRRCIAGLDLSATTDLTALALLFEDPEDEIIDVLVKFWMPQARVWERQKLDRFDYESAVNGELTLCPGETIQYSFIEKELSWARENFDLEVVCYDPWNSREFVQRLENEGYAMEEVPQTFTKLSSPMKYLEKLLLESKLRHDNRALLNWNMACLSTKSDANGNIRPAKPDRKQHNYRIDGAVAIITALAKISGKPQFTSIYDDYKIPANAN